MRILITGATRAQSGETGNQRIRYADVVDPLTWALERLGHTVTRRPATVNDTFTEFDCAIIGVTAPTGFPARYCFGWLNAVASPLPRVYLLDDWQNKVVFSGIRSAARVPNRVFDRKKEAFMQRDERDAADVPENRARLERGLEALAEPHWRVPTIAPMFPWGQHDKLKKGTHITRLIPYDPTPKVRVYDDIAPVVNWSDRGYLWVLGTLSDTRLWRESLQLKWPVEVYGCRKEKAPALPEDKLVERYGHVRGVLCQPYHHAGSGWWRNRVLYAAQRGAVLGCSDDEVGLPAYRIHPSDFERLTFNEQRDVAIAQHRQFMGAVSTEDQLIEQACTIMGAMT